MTNRNYIRISSFIAVALSAVIALALINTGKMGRYKNTLEISYQQSLSELSECLDSVNADLTKSVYSNSPDEMQKISRDLFAQCSVAKNALSRLPASQMELTNTYRFLSQAGDYAQYIGAKLEKGEIISEQEHKNLLTLLKYSEKFSSSASDMMGLVSSGAKITDGKIKNSENDAITPLSTSFSESAKTFESFPTLLYDGPFSDKVLNKKSKLVSKGNVKTKEDCRKIAAKMLGVSKSRVSYSSNEASVLPCYTYRSGRYTVSVTKQGGYIKSIIYSGISSQANITEKNAVNIAKAFLDKIGYKDMAESYYSVQDNVCTVNFAYCKNGVYCYPDLIKCGVSLDSGKIVSLDAATYLTNHVQRKAFSSKVSPSEAQKKISPYLKVKSVKKCVIPKENGSEAQCYEFTCTSRETGEDALVYINSKTGAEEDIMLLLYTDNGTLVK